MSPAHVLASGTRHLCTGHQMVLFEDRIYEYSGSCSATNQISAFWITVLKNQSLWQTHLVWMSGWDLSINPWICLCYVDKHLNTSFQSGRWVWRCWAASKGIAWRKTSQELPLQDLEGKGFSTLPSLRFLFFKLEPLESLENHHKPPKFHGLWRTHHGSAAEISDYSLPFRSMFFSRARWKKSAPWGVRQDFYAQVLKHINIGQDTININNILISHNIT